VCVCDYLQVKGVPFGIHHVWLVLRTAAPIPNSSMEFSRRSVNRRILLLQCLSALREQMPLEDFQAHAGRRDGSWLPTRASVEKQQKRFPA
jgi:hypothetical protein